MEVLEQVRTASQDVTWANRRIPFRVQEKLVQEEGRGGGGGGG